VICNSNESNFFTSSFSEGWDSDRDGRIWRPAKTSRVEDHATTDNVVPVIDVVVILAALHVEQELGDVVCIQG
jgi:hypothetical protein